jgi:hypothetical protein
MRIGIDDRHGFFPPYGLKLFPESRGPVDSPSNLAQFYLGAVYAFAVKYQHFTARAFLSLGADLLIKIVPSP